MDSLSPSCFFGKASYSRTMISKSRRRPADTACIRLAASLINKETTPPPCWSNAWFKFAFWALPNCAILFAIKSISHRAMCPLRCLIRSTHIWNSARAVCSAPSIYSLPTDASCRPLRTIGPAMDTKTRFLVLNLLPRLRGDIFDLLAEFQLRNRVEIFVHGGVALWAMDALAILSVILSWANKGRNQMSGPHRVRWFDDSAPNQLPYTHARRHRNSDILIHPHSRPARQHALL